MQDRACDGRKAGQWQQEGRPVTAGRGKARAGAGQGLPQEERARLTAGRGVRPATGGREVRGGGAAEDGQAGVRRKSKPAAGGGTNP